VAVLLALCVLGTGATLLAFHAFATPQEKKGPHAPPEPAPDDKPKKDEKPKTDLEAIQGTWHAVAGEFQGKAMPKDELDEFGKLVIKKGEFYEYFGDFPVVANLKLDPAKKPKSFDLITYNSMVVDGIKSVTETVTDEGIYQLDGDTLKIARWGQVKIRPTGFATTPDTQFAVIT